MRQNRGFKKPGSRRLKRYWRASENVAHKGRSMGRSSNEHQEGALEIPLFYENDAYGWVNRWEGYFLIKGVTKEKNLHATMVAMEGKYLS